MTRTILITGAGAGIGRETARAFLTAGWRVALIGRREAPLRATAQGHDALILPADVGDPDQVEVQASDEGVAIGRFTRLEPRLSQPASDEGIDRRRG